MQVAGSWLRTWKGASRTCAEGGACGTRARDIAPTVCPRIGSMPFTFLGVTVLFRLWRLAEVCGALRCGCLGNVAWVCARQRIVGSLCRGTSDRIFSGVCCILWVWTLGVWVYSVCAHWG